MAIDGLKGEYSVNEKPKISTCQEKPIVDTGYDFPDVILEFQIASCKQSELLGDPG